MKAVVILSLPEPSEAANATLSAVSLRTRIMDRPTVGRQGWRFGEGEAVRVGSFGTGDTTRRAVPTRPTLGQKRFLIPAVSPNRYSRQASGSDML